MAVGTAPNATTLSEKWNGTTVAILPSPTAGKYAG